ncbi:transmembrane protease serine 9-like [Bactrocera tryoni]|uniref:transmembrane protease serine 9-like n=1 Tax=Bactrocera tryoni TaxID=59916 RepID=UPI001A99F368|nr:transmembrane protease serine 9-like [Bactrocera tryoni]
MKLLIVLALALAAASATPVYEKTAFIEDLPESPVLGGRITNGDYAWDGLVPYQAGLLISKNSGNYWCGGSLIGSNWILTAAHCTDEAHTITVYLGSVVRSNGNQYATTIHSQDIHQHPNYNSNTLDNDVTLVWIHSVSFSGNIQAIRLPSFNQYSNYEGQWATASGWGGTSGNNQDHLQYVSVQVISNSECASVYGSSTVTDNTICVSTNGGRSTCGGDSGGPLAVDNNQVLIGVTSFVAAAGCTAGLPSGFQRVSRHLDWIRGVTGIFLVVLALLVAAASATPVYEKTAFIEDLPESPVLGGRITNGDYAWDGLVPYQAGLLISKNSGNYWCGGSLIGSNWILTAAHCTDEAHTITVYLGSVVRSNGNQYATTIHSQDIHQHPNYNSNTLDNDVTLVWIHSVSFSGNIQAIRLPSFNQYSNYEGQWATASGWGGTSGNNQDHLQYVSVQVISNSECASVYGSSTVTDNTICVSTNGGRSTCGGDSGGPLAVDNNQVLIGVTSFVAAAGCTAGLPSGFQRVSRHLDWIRGVTGIAYY